MDYRIAVIAGRDHAAEASEGDHPGQTVRNADAAFAVVRLDEGPGDDTGRIHRQGDRLDARTRRAGGRTRLNELNADKGCHYFWTPTRVVRCDS